MQVVKINNLFTQDYIKKINKHFKDTPEESTGFSISEELGRYQFGVNPLDEDVQNFVLEIAKSLVDFDCEFSGATGVEYNSKYGKPTLPTHFDGDWNELIINYQLVSNTQWNIGVDLNVYEMEDNSALIFHPNENVHWRPKKDFNEGEFVRMVFFRFHNKENISDYSHLRYSQDHEIFKEINKLRDSIYNG